MSGTSEEQQTPQQEWNRSIAPTLFPGMDYRDGHLYYTVPIHKEVIIPGTKNKPDQHRIEWGAEVISTDASRSFRYEPLTLRSLGWTAYDAFVVDPDSWSGDGVGHWLNGADTTTEPLDIWQRVRHLWEQYIDFGSTEIFHDIMAFWVMGTYVYKVFETFPYLKLGGTMESGKSQNLRLLDTVAFNPTYAASMTPPNLFRKVGSSAGTILIDEFEAKAHDDYYKAITELLRFGYKKGGNVLRLEPDKRTNRQVQLKFPVYGPKAIASINTLDPVTATRVIEVTMEPTLRTIPEFKADRSAYAHLINDLHYFGLAHAPFIDQRNRAWTAEFRQETCPGINNRSWEIAGPIIVLADYVGGDAMTGPLIEWFTEYFANRKRQQDSQSAHRTLVISLPTLLRNKAAYADGYYLASDVLKNFLDFSDDTKGKTKLKPFVVLNWLAAIGFDKTRPGRGGTQVQITEEALRHVFNQRRVTPRDEDIQWLDGSTEPIQTFSDEVEPDLTSLDEEAYRGQY